ncbi:hypothetical protein [Streptomyces sp. NPDC101237]|uniref:hypothetical protein n=1 Tax=Streptomyces sp. NPDC101237 TaxID=3366139 RepID=UPI00380F39C8
MTQETRTSCQTSDIRTMFSPWPAATITAPVIRVVFGPRGRVMAADIGAKAIMTRPCGAITRPTVIIGRPRP